MKINIGLAIAGLAMIALSCLRDDTSPYLKTLRFNNDHRILQVNYDNNPDTTLQQVILISGVRKNGYGLLLNVDQSLSSDDLKKLIYEFQLLDINAVHGFDINSAETPANNVLAALEQARFVWIFSNNMYNLSGSDCQPMLQALKKATGEGAILVIDESYNQKLIECMQLH